MKKERKKPPIPLGLGCIPTFASGDAKDLGEVALIYRMGCRTMLLVCKVFGLFSLSSFLLSFPPAFLSSFLPSFFSLPLLPLKILHSPVIKPKRLMVGQVFKDIRDKIAYVVHVGYFL